jgi:hypothetical protein
MVKFFNKFLFQNSLKVSLIISFLTGCAAIPANKIKLENYPEIKKEEIKNLSLNYSTFKFEPDKKGYEFDKAIISEIDQGVKVNGSSNCNIKISTMHSTPFPMLCIANYFIAGVTLFTIPYYCQHTYEARANLLSHPQDSEIQGIIKNSISQAKLGEIFLDEKNRPAKLLKTYELKDKVHEVWSLLWMLSWLVVEPNKYAPNAEYPKDAYKIMEDKISEALVRQILNDAKTFPECAKK